jgi:Protein of unknown function (DUF3078)
MKTVMTFMMTGLLLMGMWQTGHAQDAQQEPERSWRSGAGIGLDAAQLLQINPRVGAGQNRLGFGGAVNAFAKYSRNRLVWDSQGNWQFGVQRLGSGVIGSGAEVKIPFQKAIDKFQLESKLGYKITENGLLFFATNANLISQLTPTFLGTESYPGNFLTDISGLNASPQSAFLSPADLGLSAGIDFKPTDNWSIYYSPLAARVIIVVKDEIAALGVHGNPVTKDAMGAVISYKNADIQMGSQLRVAYRNKFAQGKLNYTTALQLYTNYLRDPQNIDLQFWNNEFALQLFKNLQLNITLNMYYDHDILVQITDYSFPNGVDGLGRRVSVTQQLLLKYAVTF